MDPRIERTRTAVMEAATDLLLERGPDGVTMDGVVARSGVAKSTLYRHWPTRDALLSAVFQHLAPVVPAPDPALGYEDALRALVHSIAAILADERWKPLMPALATLKARHPQIAELDEAMTAQQLAVLEPVLAKGVVEGRLVGPPAIDLVTTILVGPLVMAALTGSMPIDDALADTVVDHFLRATAPS